MAKADTDDWLFTNNGTKCFDGICQGGGISRTVAQEDEIAIVHPLCFGSGDRNNLDTALGFLQKPHDVFLAASVY